MFFEFGLKDIIDIVLVALMLYYTYRIMKESRSLNVFAGIMVFVVIWLIVSQVLEMRLLGSIMDKLVSVGVIGLIVLFQKEIRYFLYNLGAHQKAKNILKLFRSDKNKKGVDREAILPIVMACMNMGKGKVGALIVIERSVMLQDIVDRCAYRPAAHRKHFLQELSTPRRRNGNIKETHKSRRLHSSGQPQPGHTERIRASPPCGIRNFAGI